MGARVPAVTRHGGLVIPDAAHDSREAAPRLLHEIFARTARTWPEAIAIEVPPGRGRPDRLRRTYAEVARDAAALAHRLAPFVRTECVVAIVLGRDSDAVYVAQLAVLAAGAAYTCIDPHAPDARARQVLEDANPAAVIADTAAWPRLVAAGVAPERLLAPTDAAHRNGSAPVAPAWLSPASLAYVIYTSGTSGRPKGVMVEHRAIVNLVCSDREYFGLGRGDRVAQSSSTSYDSSLEEVGLAFGSGATLVVMDDDTVRLGPDLVPWLREERITVFCPPPTLLRMCACADPARALPELALLYVGGEELPADVAAAWAPGRRLENGYGPTECAVTALRTRVRAGEPVTIGVPVAGNRAFVLDEQLAEVPDGTPGELCIGGAGLARGYLHQSALTRERFVEHPHLGRLYRTGDLALRRSDGHFAYLGRTDAQVKIRGHRVELGEIESRLSALDGVVAAACKVQGAAGELTAFLVADGPRAPDLAVVRDSMRAALPEHMQPVHYAFVPELPTRDASGKLDRAALPDIVPAVRDAAGALAPRTAAERAIAVAIATHVAGTSQAGVHDDFFLDLGGNSLLAAQVISTLRQSAATAALTVRDVYEARTIAGLAARLNDAPADATAPAPAPAPTASAPSTPTLPGALVQLAWIALAVMLGASLAYLGAFRVLPALARSLGRAPLLLTLPALAFLVELAWLPVALALAALAKWTLIGRYRAGRYAWLGAFHVRHWLVQQCVRAVPWPLIEATALQNVALRLLGARIGRDVHVHRGVDLTAGGWDLLTLGDGVTLGRDAALGLLEFDARALVFAPVTLGPGATLDTRAHVAGGATVGANAFVGPLAFVPAGARVPAGERWDGVPAQASGASPAAGASAPPWSAAAHAAALIGARGALAALRYLPGLALAAACLRPGASAGLLPPPLDALPLPLVPVLLVVGYALSLPFEALAARALGRVRAGTHPLRSWTGCALVLKDALVETANGALSGTLLWPWWLRAAGARVGQRCEISTIMEVVPELLTIGDECFFADGIYLGRSLLHRGTATCAATELSSNTFFGNHVVVPAGVTLPPDLLLGICTVADPERMRAGTSWFGLPAFELPRREVTEAERTLTHEPGWERRLTRVAFELARFALPLVPLALALGAYHAAARAAALLAPATLVAVALPVIAAAVAAMLLALALVTKWFVLGPIRPGKHALWSCWCCRWDILFEVWAAWAVPVLMAFEGTPFVTWWLRAMGCRVGRGVVFGSSFLQVVDPDMLAIEDGATVSCHLQSHSFEDRVLKLAPVRIGAHSTVGRGAVLLYGADIGAGAAVAANSVVMKHEALLPGGRYAGCPTRGEGAA